MESAKSDSPAQPNKSLLNGIACFQVVAAEKMPLGSREIARRLGLGHTRVSRLLGTLASLGLVARTKNRKYIPGPGIHVLSAQSLHGSGLLSAAIPVLRRIHARRMIVALGVLWGSSVCYLVHAKPGQDPDDGIGAHSPYAAEDSVIGHVLLSYSSQEELYDGFIEQVGPEYAEEIRQRRAVCIRRSDGSLSAAAAIFSPQNETEPIAAIALTGLCSKRLADRILHILVDAAKRIAASLEDPALSASDE